MELSLSESGTITDFNRSLALAEKYKITDFETKYNIPSNVDLTAKYSFFDSLSEEDKATLKATEYINSKTENKYKVDICFDVEGNTIGVEVVKNGNNFPEVSTIFLHSHRQIWSDW